jgi:hypothetical protein
VTGPDRWQDRGVISFEQAERLEADPPPDRPGGPRTVEVLGYVAAIALVIATIAAVIEVTFSGDPIFGFLLGDFDNVSGGLVALLGAAIVFGTGYLVADHRGAVARAAGFAMFAGYLLSAGGFGLLLFDLDLGDATPLVVLIPSAAVAVTGWRRLRSVPTQLALFIVAVNAVAAILVLVQVEEGLRPSLMALTAVMGATPEFGSWVSQLVHGGLGLVWVLLARTGALGPRNAAFFIGSVYAVVFGLMLFASADGWIVLSGGLALAFVWAATQWRSSVLGAVGAVAAVVLVVQVMSLILDEPGARAFILWFGIPGLLAAAGVWLLARRAPGGVAAAEPNARPTPPPPTMTE